MLSCCVVYGLGLGGFASVGFGGFMVCYAACFVELWFSWLVGWYCVIMVYGCVVWLDSCLLRDDLGFVCVLAFIS